MVSDKCKVAKKPLGLLQHLISDPTHDFYISLKRLPRFLLSSNHLFFDTFQSPDMFILSLLKNLLIQFERPKCFRHILKKFLTSFLSISKGSFKVLYLRSQSRLSTIPIHLFLQRVNNISIFS